MIHLPTNIPLPPQSTLITLGIASVIGLAGGTILSHKNKALKTATIYAIASIALAALSLFFGLITATAVVALGLRAVLMKSDDYTASIVFKLMTTILGCILLGYLFQSIEGEIVKSLTQ